MYYRPMRPAICLLLKFRHASDLLERARSRRKHIASRTAEKDRTIVIRIAFENRHDKDETIKGRKSKNRRDLDAL